MEHNGEPNILSSIQCENYDPEVLDASPDCENTFVQKYTLVVGALRKRIPVTSSTRNSLKIRQSQKYLKEQFNLIK